MWLTLVVLDFKIPQGISFHMSQAPTPFLDSSYSIKPLPHLSGHVGFLFTSVGLQIDPKYTLNYSEIQERFQPPGMSPRSYYAEGEKPLLLYSRLFLASGKLESLTILRCNRRNQARFVVISPPRGQEAPSVPFQLINQVFRVLAARHGPLFNRNLC